MTYKIDLTVAGTVYSYPSGPFFSNYFVVRTQQGIYNFHLGDALAPYAEVMHMGTHHIKVVEDGVTLIDADVDHHPWSGEWTLRPKGLNVVRTPAQLFAGRFLPPFGNTGNVVGGVSNAKFVPFFDHADVTMYMPTTGERPDIGMVTDWSGLYLLGGSTGPMLATALAGGSCTMHFLDKTTGLPLNLILKPANAYDMPGYQPGFYINKGLKDAAGYEGYGDLWGPQKAHWCDMSYVAAIATRDPILLRDLQNAGNFVLCSNVEDTDSQGIAIMLGEYRAIGHGLGMLFKAHMATVDAETNGWFEPALHLPSSYFKKLLDVSLKYHEAAVLKSVQASRFCTLGAGYDINLGPWQHEYLMMDLGLAVLNGRTEWVPFFIKMLGNTIARTSVKSGWPPAYSAYYIPMRDSAGKDFDDWSAIWENYYASGETNLTPAEYQHLKTNPTNGGILLGTKEYFMTTHAVMVFADLLDKKGYAPVRATYPDFDIALQNTETLFRTMGIVNARVSVVLDAAASPVVMPPPTDNPPPPTDDDGDPGTPPVIIPPASPPELDPHSFAFETPTPNDGVTAHDTVYIDLTNKVPPGAEQLVFNVKGNGKTVVIVNWPGMTAGTFTVRAPTPAGASFWADGHSNGDGFRLYDCAGLIFNGSVLLASPIDTSPPPATEIDFMTDVTTLKVGETKELDLTVVPANADRTGLVYVAVPDGIVTLAPNGDTVAVTRVAEGDVQIFARLNGKEAEADATFVPLAQSLSLAWAS